MKEIGSGFVHLHVHTEYSLGQAVCRLEELLQKVKAWGMPSLAITDHGAIHGAVRFCQLAGQYGIHPIVGCEMKLQEQGGSLILLAATDKGYRQIVKWLNTGSFTPPASSGDVIALSGGCSGVIHRMLATGDVDLAKRKAKEYAAWFGQDNFYLEVQDHGLPGDRELIERTVQLSEKTGIPLVATHEVRCFSSVDEHLLDVLRDASDPPDRHSPAGGCWALPSPFEMQEKFRHLPDAIANTVRIAQRCRIRLEPEKPRLPKFPVPEGWDEETYLTFLCMEGLRKRFGFSVPRSPDEQRIANRLQRELAVIISRGLASYFLIVWDIVQFARTNGIPTGPGRGSAAGSLVVYLLGISEVNPILHELSFERFLSPDRPDLPDIDLDVCQRRRHEILQYIKRKYGPHQVARIGMLQTFGTRGAVRRAGEYLNLSLTHVNLISKLLPAFSGRGGIAHCLQKLPELQTLPLTKKPYQSWFRLAERIEGLPRAFSTHPSAVLIGNEDVTETIHLYKNTDGDWPTFFNKDDVQALGLLKIDLLGLRTLTVIHDTFRFIRELTGKRLTLADIPLDDADTFETIEEGATLGCFQLESMGIRSLMRRIRPGNLEDLTAVLSLYRPGAWQEGIVEDYLRRQRGGGQADFPLLELEPILAKTFGLILYQEQVMQIAHAVAGYSMGEADALRRALAKKELDSLEDHRARFVRGAMQRGHSEKDALRVFDFLARFAGYSFNKAHSVSYAYLSYWTVYLKTHYPKEYMAALLSSEGGYYDKKVYLREIGKMGISLLRPDVNRSGFGFRAEREGIRAGIDLIRGCGPGSVSALLDSREKNGPFRCLRDLVTRMKGYGVKGPILKAWVAAGACDSLHGNRRQMLAALDSPQGKLFDDAAAQAIDDFSDKEKRRMEKHLLGFPLEHTPSAEWRQFVQRYRIVPIESVSDLPAGSRVRIAGAIIHSRRQPTETGDYLLVLVLQDDSEMAEVILYPQTYKACLYELHPGGIVVEGIVRGSNRTWQIVAEKIKALGG